MVDHFVAAQAPTLDEAERTRRLHEANGRVQTLINSVTTVAVHGSYVTLQSKLHVHTGILER